MTIETLLVNVLRAGDKEENRRQCLYRRGLQSTIREPKKHVKTYVDNQTRDVFKAYGRRERKYLPLPGKE